MNEEKPKEIRFAGKMDVGEMFIVHKIEITKYKTLTYLMKEEDWNKIHLVQNGGEFKST